MLLVNARVGPSSIHGLGLIAHEFIPEGTRIARFAPGLDLALSQAQLEALPELAQRTFRHYSYRGIHSRKFMLCYDDARFMNHAEVPNTDGSKALRDIAPGEELTYDYRKWDLDFEWKLSSISGLLTCALEDKDREVRFAVLRALSKIGFEDKALVPVIGEKLKDTHPDIRYYAAKLLAKIGAEAGLALPALGAALTDERPETRYFAAKCLSKIGPAATDVMRPLIEALKDSQPNVRYYSAKALGRIGAAAKAAIEPLRAALHDRDKKVCEAANQALRRIEKLSGPGFS